MNVRQGVRSAAPDAPDAAIAGLEAVQERLAGIGAMDSELRMAHLIGQCAHESLRFTVVAESLFYTTADRAFAIFPRHFRNISHAAEFLRDPEKMANHVYANRNGNGPPASGDGFRFRGRGYLQLTGRANYTVFGNRLGIDLIARPELAEEPETAWLIAASFLATRGRAGRLAFEWADRNNVEMVTRIVNGGTHGLPDRRQRTALALAGLGGNPPLQTLRQDDVGETVALLQRALAALGHALGAIDGHFGKKTLAAVKAFQRAQGLDDDGVVGKDTWAVLEPLPV